MLNHCVATVQHLDRPEGMAVEIAVIDNSEAEGMRARNREVLDSLPRRFPLTQIYEPALGIPYARNRAIDHALAVGAVALVFLDDDQTVPHDWLTTLARVAQEEHADVVKSGVTFVLEGDMRFAEHFAPGNTCLPSPIRESGIRYVATNGVWISARLFREMGLRFDETLRFLGCDDTAYFLEAYRRDAKMVATSEVFAQEIVMRDKQSLRWLARRSFRGGVSRATLRLGDRSRAYYGTSGFAQLLYYGGLAVLLVWHQRLATGRLLRAIRAAGILWGAIGGTFDEYRRVTGK